MPKATAPDDDEVVEREFRCLGRSWECVSVRNKCHVLCVCT